MNTRPVYRSVGKRPDNSRPMAWVLLQKYGMFGALKLLYTDVLPDFIQRIDTARPVANSQLSDNDHLNEHNRYVPSTFDAVQSCLDYIAQEVDFSTSGFLDYGSGKGKALIAAARYPFAQLTGVEINQNLNDIAQENLATLRLQQRIKTIACDGAVYRPEPIDTVLYFFNPFTGDVLERCLAGIAAASLDVQRHIIYVNPTEDDVFCRYFQKTGEENFYPGNNEVNFYKTLSE